MTDVATHPSVELRAAPARTWLVATLGVALFAPLSYFVLDRPLAQLAFDNLRPYRKMFDALTHIVDPFAVIAVVVFVCALVQMARRRAIGPVLEKFLRASTALCVAIAAKDQFKYAFGRTWPETWTNNNPSYFGNGVYGFFPFHGGQGWYAFPSGHTTAVCAVAAALWVLWPRGRPVYALAVALVVIGLIGADYHWLSDIVVGGALGIAVGVAAAKVGRTA